MATASSNNGSQKIRFGLFEADLRSGELFRDGSKVRLQEQPFQILAMLLDRAGEVVTREEMRERLWPADTFVDFDHSLNAAIRRLRDALGDTAENLAKQYQITRAEVDAFAARSFDRAVKAQASGFLAGEITPVATEQFEIDGMKTRGIRIKDSVAADTHVRTSTLEQLAKIRPAFGGVQTGGNSSAIVDGAAAILVGNKDYATKLGTAPLARIVASAAVGVPPEIMGVGPVPAIKAVCERAGVPLEIAQERLALGDALLIFPEGSRSRSAQMQPLLAGVARYLESPGVRILPMGITGTERLFPIGEGALTPVPLTLRIGAPIAASALRGRAQGNRQAMMDMVGAAIAQLLPSPYRGVYDSD